MNQQTKQITKLKTESHRWIGLENELHLKNVEIRQNVTEIKELQTTLVRHNENIETNLSVIRRQSLKIEAQATVLTQQAAAIKALETQGSTKHTINEFTGIKNKLDECEAREKAHLSRVEKLEKELSNAKQSVNFYLERYSTNSKELAALKQSQTDVKRNYEKLKQSHKTVIDQSKEQKKSNEDEDYLVVEDKEQKKKRNRNRNRNRKKKKPEIEDKADAISSIESGAVTCNTDKVNQVNKIFLTLFSYFRLKPTFFSRVACATTSIV